MLSFSSTHALYHTINVFRGTSPSQVFVAEQSEAVPFLVLPYGKRFYRTLNKNEPLHFSYCAMFVSLILSLPSYFETPNQGDQIILTHKIPTYTHLLSY